MGQTTSAGRYSSSSTPSILLGDGCFSYRPRSPKRRGIPGFWEGKRGKSGNLWESWFPFKNQFQCVLMFMVLSLLVVVVVVVGGGCCCGCGHGSVYIPLF